MLNLPGSAIPAVQTASLVLKLALLLLESRNKTHLLRGPDKKLASESTGDVFSRVLFWWLNPVLWRGNMHELAIDDLPHVDNALLNDCHFHQQWNHGKSSKSMNSGLALTRIRQTRLVSPPPPMGSR